MTRIRLNLLLDIKTYIAFGQLSKLSRIISDESPQPTNQNDIKQTKVEQYSHQCSQKGNTRNIHLMIKHKTHSSSKYNLIQLKK